MTRLSRLVSAGTGLLIVLTGCVSTFPADPEGTLTRVSGGVLRVGASENPPYVVDEGQALSGDEVALVEGYAASRDVDIEWIRGGEEDLMGRLEHGDVDLVIGGLTDETPWVSKAGLTRPYEESVDRFGSQQKHVLAVPLGENAFLLDLDEYLHDTTEGS